MDVIDKSLCCVTHKSNTLKNEETQVDKIESLFLLPCVDMSKKKKENIFVFRICIQLGVILFTRLIYDYHTT
jgi:hypothetical protein